MVSLNDMGTCCLSSLTVFYGYEFCRNIYTDIYVSEITRNRLFFFFFLSFGEGRRIKDSCLFLLRSIILNVGGFK